MSAAHDAVLTFTRRQIAKALASAAILGGAQFSAHCAKAFGIFRVDVDPPAGSILSTLTLVNSGTATQAAGVPTQTFGWVFKDGDIAPGTAPKFSTSGVAQRFSAGLQSYWPSGCLKFAAFMLLPTFSLRGGAAQAVTISSGGSWPAASSRTLSDVYNQKLVANAPAFPSAYNSRSGTWSSWLLGDSNNDKQVVWLDGAAGKAWKISTSMAQTQGGSPDGQLVFDHYIIALNNASGGLGGFRWLGALRQPKYNNDTPAKSFVFFSPPSASSPASGVNWRVADGAPTPLPWPFRARAFTNSPGTTLSTTTANHYFTGGGANGNTLPVVLAGSSLPSTSTKPPAGPSAMADNAIAFLLTSIAPDNPNNFSLCWSGICSGDSVYNLTSAGSGTVTPVPGLWSFNRIMFATTDAKYNFFQGTGSIAVETTLRAQINQVYWQSSRLFQPFDLSLRGSNFGGVISDTTFSYDWHPYSIGDLAQYQPGTGDHPDIGALPNQACVDFYNQSARSEKLIRIIGLSAALQIFDFKDATTDTVVNLSNKSYSGLPGSVATTVGWGGYDSGGASGFTSPPTAGGAIGYAGSGAEHEPCYAYWAYLRTGELQYLDFITENGIGQILQSPKDFRNPSPSSGGPYAAYGVVLNWNDAGGELRSMGWAHRDVQIAALIHPWNPATGTDTLNSTTQIGQYLNDLADANANYPIDQFNAGSTVYGAQAAYVQARGLWAPYFKGIGYGNNGPEWELCYIGMSMCWAAVRGNAKARQFLSDIMARRWNYIGEHYKGRAANGFWHLYHYGQVVGLFNEGMPGQIVSPMIGSDPQWAIVMQTFYNPPGYSGTAITWRPNSPGASAFAVGIPGQGYVPSNGDIYTPDPSFGPTGYPSTMNYNRQYYLINLTRTGTGYTFDLCASPPPANTPVSVTDHTGPQRTAWFYITSANPPLTHWPAYGDDYVLNIRAAACWANAIGIRGFADILADADYRLRHTEGGPYTTYSALPAGRSKAIDCRYCNQPTFA